MPNGVSRSSTSLIATTKRGTEETPLWDRQQHLTSPSSRRSAAFSVTFLDASRDVATDQAVGSGRSQMPSRV